MYDLSTSQLELSIVIPCLNEAETLAICIQKAKAFLSNSAVSGEVVIADNGSTDGSQAIAEAEGARVVAVPRRGYGAALIGGIEAAQGKYVIMGDADDSYDFSALMPFVERLRGGADIVMGNRFKGGIAEGAMPFLHRYLGNPVLSWLGRLFFKVPTGDFHCGLRGFSRERVRALNLRTTGMEFASEMVVCASLEKYRIEEVPTTLAKDGRSRPPHLRTWRDGWRHLSFLLMYSPRWLFLYPGLALSAIGLLAGFLLFPGHFSVGSVTFDIHTFIVTSFLLVLGVQAISFAVLSRKFVSSHQMMPPSQLSSILNALTLERLLIVAAILFFGGLAGLLNCTLQWSSSGFGPLEYSQMLRVLIASMTAMIIGGQLAFTAFLSGIVAIPTR
ncbi:glycosyltransferase family 2 protein [Donghicola tyrosinivorans]|uniref:Glycosyltransferase involved in cell wall biosynthesis n=1 Tax=Donghicola tyrosinivorans TaxID=1652492 RepID=A0A2T0WWC3_9RHOB|nr:glycosyltransferase family 2 protein [Donghicola tyrosinivorans]PRY90990.1 glycosyltransferase involved in cell wall biosynthesis [Donghicola tyrosinivorans]